MSSPASPNLIIAASAGSGKTYRLTRHYIRLLRQALAIHEASIHQPGARLQVEFENITERILATTFTRVAAREIIDRILLALAEAIVFYALFLVH